MPWNNKLARLSLRDTQKKARVALSQIFDLDWTNTLAFYQTVKYFRLGFIELALNSKYLLKKSTKRSPRQFGLQ